MFLIFFFFKQKTAYEIRKGDWSSDVCSSDLGKELSRWKTRCAEGHAKFSDIAAGSKIFPPMFVWLVSGASEDLATGFQRAAQTYQGRAAYRTELLLYASLPASLFLLGLMILSQIYPVTQLIFGLPKSLSF